MQLFPLFNIPILFSLINNDNDNIYWKKNITLKRNKHLEIIAENKNFFSSPEVSELIKQS